MTSAKEVWIGLVLVKFLPSYKHFRRDEGAYVNALTWTANALEFRTRVSQTIMEYGDMQVKEFKEIEPLSKRLENYHVHRNILRLAEKVRKKHNVQFDSFCTYPRRRKERKNQREKTRGVPHRNA